MFYSKPLPPDAGTMKCRDLSGLYLHCFCGNHKCGHYAAHFLHDLVERHKVGFLELGRLMLRLRCQRCREEPARVVLMRAERVPPGVHRQGNSRDQIELLS